MWAPRCVAAYAGGLLAPVLAMFVTFFVTMLAVAAGVGVMRGAVKLSLDLRINRVAPGNETQADECRMGYRWLPFEFKDVVRALTEVAPYG